MKRKKKDPGVKPYPVKKHLRNLAMITLGALVTSASYCIFIAENDLLAGGSWGVAGIFHYLLPFIPMAVFVVLINIPLLIWGWNKLNLRFALYTAYTVLLQSVLLLFLPDLLPTYTNDILLACLFGGLLGGAGAGVVVRYHGSGGGSEIVGIILKDKYDISVGNISLGLNALIVVAASFIFGFERGMYTILQFFVSSFIFNSVLEGMNQKRNMMIVTDKGQELATRLLYECGRGVTVVKGEGGYTHHAKEVLFCVISRFEMATVKDLIRETDPNAFVCINQTYEVMGRFPRKAIINQVLEEAKK